MSLSNAIKNSSEKKIGKCVVGLAMRRSLGTTGFED